MPLRLVLFALLVLASGSASAPPSYAADEPDELTPGTVTVIKPGKLVKFVAKPPTGTTFDLPDATNDPTAEGGELAVFDTAPLGPAANSYALPPAGWKALAGGKGYKYKGTGATDDPCKVVLVKGTVVKAVCKGTGVTLTTPFTGEVGIVLTIGTDSKRYCASFGGTGVKNDDAGLKRKDAPPPPACPTSVMWSDGDVVTYGQDSWGGDPTMSTAAALVLAQFDSRYPGGLEVGVPGTGGFSMIFTSGPAVLSYQPGSGTPGPLNSDLVDPTSTSSGVFGGHVLALQLDVDFTDAGLISGTSGLAFGDLRICGLTLTPDYNGTTVRQFLAAMNTVLGGGPLAYSFDDVSFLERRDHRVRGWSREPVRAATFAPDSVPVTHGRGRAEPFQRTCPFPPGT